MHCVLIMFVLDPPLLLPYTSGSFGAFGLGAAAHQVLAAQQAAALQAAAAAGAAGGGDYSQLGLMGLHGGHNMASVAAAAAAAAAAAGAPGGPHQGMDPLAGQVRVCGFVDLVVQGFGSWVGCQLRCVATLPPMTIVVLHVVLQGCCKGYSEQALKEAGERLDVFDMLGLTTSFC
jgi:hypothetical protein